MTKMNWTKPNAGYSIRYLPREKPLPTFPAHAGHKIIKVATPKGSNSPHAGHYRCLTCNKFLQWYPK